MGKVGSYCVHIDIRIGQIFVLSCGAISMESPLV